MAPVCLRDLTVEEGAAVMKLAHSLTAPVRLAERAKIISPASRGDPQAGYQPQLDVVDGFHPEGPASGQLLWKDRLGV
jgi:hypothetical protein